MSVVRKLLKERTKFNYNLISIQQSWDTKKSALYRKVDTLQQNNNMFIGEKLVGLIWIDKEQIWGHYAKEYLYAKSYTRKCCTSRHIIN